MKRFDNERLMKIGELVITVKLMSLVFFAVAVFVEIPILVKDSHTLLKMNFTNVQYRTIIACVVLSLLFILLLFLAEYYKKRYNEKNLENKKYIVYDVTETVIFLLLDTLLILLSGANESPYKIIFFFIMISVTIQHGVKYGLIVSAASSAIVLAIDLIKAPVKPNTFFQIDLILVGSFLIVTWLVGYYRSVEAQYSSKMSNLANRDDLTGLYSHGYFQSALSNMINQAESNGKPISLLFIDIDYFKYFNDLYGHQIGDEVLKEIGARISSHLKPSHIAARYGGEEFTVIMYDTAEADAVRFAETIRKDIEKAFDKKYNEVKKITVSIGIGCYPTKAKNKDELIKCADDALYRAKSFHRNRVETFQSVLEELKSDIVEEDDMSIINSMKTLIGVINSKDKYTYRHIERVVVYCGIIADALKINDKDKKILKYGAYLHDIGKINIPEEILNKKMPLTKEEWDMLKQHPAYGVDIVSPVKSLVDSIPIILHHHERYDGGGYPTGLAGEQIPYLARVLTVADCFDAMTSNRPYSIARSVEDAIGELIACSSTQFDPEIVEAFVGVLRDNNNIF